MNAIRLKTNPIITPATPGFLNDEGANINGPSLIRVPEWVKNPLGKYYLYFAHHAGTHIRMAYADDLAGPWQVHGGGVLDVRDTVFNSHVASPDVIVDNDAHVIRMYFHGLDTALIDRFRDAGEPPQRTCLATSPDGLIFTADTVDLGPFYFRVFRYDGWYYALCKPGDGMRVCRSRTGTEPFESGPVLNPRTRHTAVRLEDGALIVAYTDIGDSPERIYAATVDVTRDWMQWRLDDVRELLCPETGYEGAFLPAEPSRAGAVKGPVNQLRDPAFFGEGGKTYLLYAVAGESGIAVAELGGL